MTASDFDRRVLMHAALGEPVRLALVDDLVCSDRSPKDLCARHGLTTNLLAHHLDVLEAAGLVARCTSAGDRRRRYVRLVPQSRVSVRPVEGVPSTVLFLCTHNSARSQLAAALWTARTGGAATSAGTHPAPKVHRGAVAAARRVGLDLGAAAPRLVDRIPADVQVITVCDRVHEELLATDQWWHWSVPDPVDLGTADAFDAALHDLDTRIRTFASSQTDRSPS
jgi:protein-tyrosine-phosphatase